MTRAVKDSLLRTRDHRARKVRALLTEGHELARGHAHQQARIVFVRVRESDRSANSDVVDRGESLYGGAATSLAMPVLRDDPELAQRERRARQHHEPHELAAFDVQVLRP